MKIPRSNANKGRGLNYEEGSCNRTENTCIRVSIRQGGRPGEGVDSVYSIAGAGARGTSQLDFSPGPTPIHVRVLSYLYAHRVGSPVGAA